MSMNMGVAFWGRSLTIMTVLTVLLAAVNIAFFVWPVEAGRCSITVWCELPPGECKCSCDRSPCECSGSPGTGCYCDCPWWEGDTRCKCPTIE